MRILKFILVLFAGFLVSCSQPSGLSTDGSGNTQIRMVPPSFLNLRLLQASDLELVVNINDDPLDMVQDGEIWTGTTTVPMGTAVSLKVEWFQKITDANPERLILALAQDSLESIENNVQFTVNDESYSIQFDRDGDTFTNLDERRMNTDPYDPDSNPDSGTGIQPMVIVPPSLQPNVIDGSYNDVYWRNAQFEDVNGAKLAINNLISDDNALEADQEPDYQWAAIHDEQFLTLFVFGKVGTSVQGNLHGDSGSSFFQDDGLEIFFDGDLSRLNDYDTVDDMHIMMPLLRGMPSVGLEGNRSGETDTRITRGANVKAEVPFDVDNVEFATCVCLGDRVTWEIRIDLADAGIPVGQTFGFEIQINQDDDGGPRDSKWAWAEASLQPNSSSVESDKTWRHPRLMGTMLLLPFPQ